METIISVDSKGYGKIYKAVMRDRELPILAKTIYAYFCSYAGCGGQAYPKRDKIVRDLQMNKDTYTKHLGLLVGRGYITKERTATGNLYTIQQSVPGYHFIGEDEAGLGDFLVFENITAHGFGTVPKLVMLDPDLTPQAKAIYAYFAAFAGAGTISFPKRSTVLRELRIGSVGTYYRHFNLLIEKGYLSVEQRKDNGRFDICIYRLNNMVSAGMSEKSKHGDPLGAPDTGMSEKMVRGGKTLKSSSISSEKLMSEKVVSEKTEPQNVGRNNNNNQNITNRIHEKEQENNHQREEKDSPFHAFTPDEVMELIRYEKLRQEFEGWGSLLKNTLGQLPSPKEERRYQQVTTEILTELVNQITESLNTAECPGRILEAMQGAAFSCMIDGFLEHWSSIRHVKSYVAASIANLIRSESAML